MPDDEPPSERRVRRRDLIRWFVGLLIGVVAVIVATNVAGGLSAAVSALERLDLRWLAPAVVVEAASYLLLGSRIRRLVGTDVVGRVEATQLGLIVSGFGLLTPASPAEGLAISAMHLRRRGLSRRTVAIVFGFVEWFAIRVFLFLASVNLFVVAAIEHDPLSELWPFLAAAGVVLVLLFVTGRLAMRPAAATALSVLLGWFHRPSRRHHRDHRRARVAALQRDALAVLGPPRRRATLVLLTAGGILADVGCLWFALRAAHAHVGFHVALLAITVAAVSLLVPLVPGGLGIVEAAIPAVAHHYGVPLDAGLAAAIVYRTFSTFVPAALGGVSIVDLRLRRRTPLNTPS